MIPRLQITGLTKAYPSVVANDGVNLTVQPGEIHAVLGENGAGKSTVLRIMAGVDTDFTGEARPQPGIKVGYLEQEPRLNPEQTVRQAVEEGVGELLHAQAELDAVYAAYAEEDADFDALAAEQAGVAMVTVHGRTRQFRPQIKQRLGVKRFRRCHKNVCMQLHDRA
mgnify:CR=1 FL=1